MMGDNGGRSTGKSTRRRFLSIAGATVATAGIGGTAAAQSGSSAKNLCFPNQTTDGTYVTVESVTLSDGGFVAVHDGMSLLEGKPVESVIGVSEYLGAGTHRNVRVPLYEDVPGASFDRSKLTDGQLVVAMPHRDTNSSEVYEFVATEGNEDRPYTKSGRPVINPAVVSVEESG